MFRLGILQSELDNFPDAAKCLIYSFSEGMATFEPGAGYDEDPLLIGLDNDGNRDRFHVQIIGIPALMLFLGAHASYLMGIMHQIQNNNFITISDSIRYNTKRKILTGIYYSMPGAGYGKHGYRGDETGQRCAGVNTAP